MCARGQRRNRQLNNSIRRTNYIIQSSYNYTQHGCYRVSITEDTADLILCTCHGLDTSLVKHTLYGCKTNGTSVCGNFSVCVVVPSYHRFVFTPPKVAPILRVCGTECFYIFGLFARVAQSKQILIIKSNYCILNFKIILILPFIKSPKNQFIYNNLTRLIHLYKYENFF